MSEVAQHYDALLADHYTWMLGGDLEATAAGDRAWFDQLGVRPGRVAIDLGCGPGPQTLALSDLGFPRVVGVDTSRQLLDELAEHARTRSGVETIQDDLVTALPAAAGSGSADVITCMRDTLLHLPSRDAVATIFSRAAAALAAGGSLILTYRDLTQPLDGLDRFLPVRSDADRIMLCVLDFTDTGRVIVNDLVYTRTDGEWVLHKSSYPKLRLAPGWVNDQLIAAGLSIAHHAPGQGGMWATVATKPS